MPDLVAHHYLCVGCGYDLYQQPLSGTCPECGKAIPRRRTLLKPKNDNRVNAGLRSSIRRNERARRSALCMAAAFALLITCALWFDWPRWIVIFGSPLLLISALSALSAHTGAISARERIIPTRPIAPTE